MISVPHVGQLLRHPCSQNEPLLPTQRRVCHLRPSKIRTCAMSSLKPRHQRVRRNIRSLRVRTISDAICLPKDQCSFQQWKLFSFNRLSWRDSFLQLLSFSPGTILTPVPIGTRKPGELATTLFQVRELTLNF